MPIYIMVSVKPSPLMGASRWDGPSLTQCFGHDATHASLDDLAAVVAPGSEGVVVLPHFPNG